jgi:hypothetical protein
LRRLKPPPREIPSAAVKAFMSSDLFEEMFIGRRPNKPVEKRKRGKTPDDVWTDIRRKHPRYGAPTLTKRLSERGFHVDISTVTRRLQKERDAARLS